MAYGSVQERTRKKREKKLRQESELPDDTTVESSSVDRSSVECPGAKASEAAPADDDDDEWGEIQYFGSPASPPLPLEGSDNAAPGARAPSAHVSAEDLRPPPDAPRRAPAPRAPVRTAPWLRSNRPCRHESRCHSPSFHSTLALRTLKLHPAASAQRRCCLALAAPSPPNCAREGAGDCGP